MSARHENPKDIIDEDANDISISPSDEAKGRGFASVRQAVMDELLPADGKSVKRDPSWHKYWTGTA